MAQANRVALLLFCAAGIYASYLTQGVVQETLATKKFGAEQARFTQLKALNGFQSIACFLWALILILVTHSNREGQPPITAYSKAAISNSIGPACGFEALKNISYPAQVLAKSCKMIPVMLMGTLVSGKRYSSIEYFCALVLAAGISLFASKSSSKVDVKLYTPNAPLGYFLCLSNLVLDGYTNAAQDEINKKYKKATPLWTMCWMNFWCSLYYGVYLFVLNSSGWDMLAFCRQYPQAAWDILLFCSCGAVGQLFIFLTIKKFGSLANTTVCTTRKFFNILLSVVWNGNPLLPRQWAAVGLVFVGLAANTVYKSRGSKAARTHLPKHQD